MTHSRRPRRALRLIGIAALGLALANSAWTRASSGASPEHGADRALVSMVREEDACRQGGVEEFLNDWLDSTDRLEFDSELAAAAFDKLVELVSVVRDLAEDFCV